MSNLGLDFWCEDDITWDWRLGDSEEQSYLQACYRRLYLTGLFYSVDGYGAGVEGWLLDTITQVEMTGIITSQLLLDERTRDVTVTWFDTGATILVMPHSGQEFPLTLAIGDVATALEIPPAEE